jgi:hypothetical protein
MPKLKVQLGIELEKFQGWNSYIDHYIETLEFMSNSNDKELLEKFKGSASVNEKLISSCYSVINKLLECDNRDEYDKEEEDLKVTDNMDGYYEDEEIPLEELVEERERPSSNSNSNSNLTKPGQKTEFFVDTRLPNDD